MSLFGNNTVSPFGGGFSLGGGSSSSGLSSCFGGGGSGVGLFGNASKPQTFGSGGGLFGCGFGSNNQSRSIGGSFGNAGSTGLFGGTSQIGGFCNTSSPFGQSVSSLGGGLFASSSTSTGGGLFNQSSSALFGQSSSTASSPFGSGNVSFGGGGVGLLRGVTSNTNTGGGIFGSSTSSFGGFCNQQKFQPTRVEDMLIYNISAENQFKNQEEVRWEVYQQKQQQQQQGAQSSSFLSGGATLFGNKPTGGGLFGQSSTGGGGSLFGQAQSSSVFGNSSGNSFDGGSSNKLFGGASSSMTQGGSGLFGNKSTGGGFFGSASGGGGFWGSNTGGSLLGGQSTGSLFGASQQNRLLGGQSSSFFGNTNSGSSIFGQTFGANTASSLFGSTTGGGGIFGNNAGMSQGSGLFGGSQTSGGIFSNFQANSGGGGLFSGNQTSSLGGVGLFGNTESSLFGSTSASSSAFCANTGVSIFGSGNTTSSLFGSATANSQTQTGSSLFGGGSLFNSSSNANATTGGLFLGSSSTTTFGSSLFGNQNRSFASGFTGSSLFSANTQSSFGGASGFGMLGGGGGGLFGGSSQSSGSLFGNLGSTSGTLSGGLSSLFGNTNVSMGGNLFGSSASNAAPSSSLFGGGDFLGGNMLQNCGQNKAASSNQNFFSMTDSACSKDPYGLCNLFGGPTLTLSTGKAPHPFLDNQNLPSLSALSSSGLWKPPPERLSRGRRYRHSASAAIFKRDVPGLNCSFALPESVVNALVKAPRLSYLSDFITSGNSNSIFHSQLSPSIRFSNGLPFKVNRFGSRKLNYMNHTQNHYEDNRDILSFSTPPSEEEESYMSIFNSEAINRSRKIDTFQPEKSSWTTEEEKVYPNRRSSFVGSKKSVLESSSPRRGAAKSSKNNLTDFEQTKKASAEGVCTVALSGLLPKLTKKGYATRPSIQALSTYDELKLAHVEDFAVIHEDYGEIMWPGVTDVRQLDLDSIVEIDKLAVIVYKNQKSPPLGEGLNKEAIVLLRDCVPKKEGLPYDDPAWKEEHREKVEKYTERMGAKFISLNTTTWDWKFMVSHFSKYGMPMDWEGLYDISSPSRGAAVCSSAVAPPAVFCEYDNYLYSNSCRVQNNMCAEMTGDSKGARSAACYNYCPQSVSKGELVSSYAKSPFLVEKAVPPFFMSPNEVGASPVWLKKKNDFTFGGISPSFSYQLSPNLYEEENDVLLYSPSSFFGRGKSGLASSSSLYRAARNKRILPHQTGEEVSERSPSNLAEQSRMCIDGGNAYSLQEGEEAFFNKSELGGFLSAKNLKSPSFFLENSAFLCNAAMMKSATVALHGNEELQREKPQQLVNFCCSFSSSSLDTVLKWTKILCLEKNALLHNIVTSRFACRKGVSFSAKGFLAAVCDISCRRRLEEEDYSAENPQQEDESSDKSKVDFCQNRNAFDSRSLHCFTADKTFDRQETMKLSLNNTNSNDRSGFIVTFLNIGNSTKIHRDTIGLPHYEKKNNNFLSYPFLMLPHSEKEDIRLVIKKYLLAECKHQRKNESNIIAQAEEVDEAWSSHIFVNAGCQASVNDKSKTLRNQHSFKNSHYKLDNNNENNYNNNNSYNSHLKRSLQVPDLSLKRGIPKDVLHTIVRSAFEILKEIDLTKPSKSDVRRLIEYQLLVSKHNLFVYEGNVANPVKQRLAEESEFLDSYYLAPYAYETWRLMYALFASNFEENEKENSFSVEQSKTESAADEYFVFSKIEREEKVQEDSLFSNNLGDLSFLHMKSQSFLESSKNLGNEAKESMCSSKEGRSLRETHMLLHDWFGEVNERAIKRYFEGSYIHRKVNSFAKNEKDRFLLLCVFYLLSAGKILEAVECLCAAEEVYDLKDASVYPHLALIIAEQANQDFFQNEFANQYNYFLENGLVDKMPLGIRLIYQLLGGHIHELPSIFALDWRTTLYMYMIFQLPIIDSEIELKKPPQACDGSRELIRALIQYEKAFNKKRQSNTLAPFPFYYDAIRACEDEVGLYLKQGEYTHCEFDLQYNILRFFSGLISADMKYFDVSTHTPYSLDYSLSWPLGICIYAVLKAGLLKNSEQNNPKNNINSLCSVKDKEDNEEISSNSMSFVIQLNLFESQLNRLHVFFSSQLESAGFWHWSCFPLMLLSNTACAKRAIRELIFRNVVTISEDSDKNISYKMNVIVNLLGIPKAWWYEGLAIYEERHYRYLLAASYYYEAYLSLKKFTKGLSENKDAKKDSCYMKFLVKDKEEEVRENNALLFSYVESTCRNLTVYLPYLILNLADACKSQRKKSTNDENVFYEDSLHYCCSNKFNPCDNLFQMYETCTNVIPTEYFYLKKTNIFIRCLYWILNHNFLYLGNEEGIFFNKMKKSFSNLNESRDDFLLLVKGQISSLKKSSNFNENFEKLMWESVAEVL